MLSVIICFSNLYIYIYIILIQLSSDRLVEDLYVNYVIHVSHPVLIDKEFFIF